jgi:hypothetical protein
MVARGVLSRAGLVCLVCVACVVVVGCGGAGGGLPAGVVAAVGARQVSMATLEHWAQVEGKLANETQPGVPNQAWVQPDPPSYAGCVARLEPAGQATSTAVAARLRYACEASYRDLESKALNYLLRLMWEEQEAVEQHITLTRPEIEREYEVFTRREFPEPGELQRLLSYSGMSVADEMMRIKKDMLQTKLQVRLVQQLRAAIGNAPAERAAHAALTNRQARLLNETNCQTGHLVEVCRQYRGVMRIAVQ